MGAWGDPRPGGPRLDTPIWLHATNDPEALDLTPIDGVTNDPKALDLARIDGATNDPKALDLTPIHRVTIDHVEAMDLTP